LLDNASAKGQPKDNYRLTIFPVVTVKGPAMAKDDRLPRRVAPVLVIDFGLVFRSDERHGAQLWVVLREGVLDVK
jgi:hypothetical protein